VAQTVQHTVDAVHFAPLQVGFVMRPFFLPNPWELPKMMHTISRSGLGHVICLLPAVRLG
jgi:hypothetical protein